MRCLAVALLGSTLVQLSLLSCCWAQDASQSPTLVEVVTSRTQVYAGPGDRYYPTAQLGRGERLEVYRSEPNGWLAIRPPADSFSWVSADQVRSTEDPEVGEITQDYAVSWVGTDLEEVADHKWQVRLPPGERVLILGRATAEIYSGAESEEFVKIAPPAGEFRWIHEQDVRLLEDQQAYPVAAHEQIDGSHTALVDHQVQIPPSRAGDGFTARARRLGASAQRLASRPSRASSKPAAPTPQRLSSSLLKDHLRDIELRLAKEVTAPPSLWQLDALATEVKQLKFQAGNTLQRGRLHVLEERIHEFKLLQQGYAGLALQPPLTEIQANTDPTPASTLGTNLDPRFDGSGWLLPVHSSKRESPPYALLDKDGNILQFVSPAPGLNLHRYLRKEIGIYGQQSTTVLNKPHLTALRVVDLARHR